MPFTCAHPAIVLPLLNKRLKIFSATGLIIGSIIPDFESFIRLDEHKVYGHTWIGMFWFDLPLAVIAAFIFHDLVRDPFIRSLPRFLENKFAGYVGFKWNPFFRKHFVKVIISMLIGIALHLLWDAFTHLNLANPDAVDSNLYIDGIRVFKALQDSNSIIGLVVVVVYILLMPRTTAPEAPEEKMIMPLNSSGKYHLPEQTRAYFNNRTDGVMTWAGKLKYWALVCLIAAMTVFLAMNLITRHVTFVLFIDINFTGLLLGLMVASGVEMVKGRRGY